MSDNFIQKQIGEIEQIYAEYEKEMEELFERQNQLTVDLIRKKISSEKNNE